MEKEKDFFKILSSEGKESKMKSAIYKSGDVLFNEEAWVSGRAHSKVEILHVLPPINKNDRFKYVCKLTSWMHNKNEEPWYKIENEYDLHEGFSKATEEEKEQFNKLFNK